MKSKKSEIKNTSPRKKTVISGQKTENLMPISLLLPFQGSLTLIAGSFSYRKRSGNYALPRQGRHFLFTLILLTFLVFPSFPQPTDFSSEMPPEKNTEISPADEESPKIIKLSSREFVRIENPRTLSTFGLDPNLESTKKIKEANDIWNQYQKEMELYRKSKNYPKNHKKNFSDPKLLFYIYTVKEDKSKYLDTFLGLYARFSTSQATLASVNRISNPGAVHPGFELILPVMQGLFIPKNPESTLEILLQKEFSTKISTDTIQYEIDDNLFYFLPDAQFSPTIMAFFHDKGMQLPLSKKIITSQFGYRVSPISGKWKFHAGIDLAAPVGTEVFACKHGLVLTTDETHELYGKYIDIKHDGNTVSRYAHLSKIMVKKGERVSTGKTIGLVGTTGASTGPHLHFEVRENGKPQDPLKVINN